MRIAGREKQVENPERNVTMRIWARSFRAAMGSW
jgi:hypothetical protein